MSSDQLFNPGPHGINSVSFRCLRYAVVFALLASIALTLGPPVIIALVLYAEAVALVAAAGFFALADHLDEA